MMSTTRAVRPAPPAPPAAPVPAVPPAPPLPRPAGPPGQTRQGGRPTANRLPEIPAGREADTAIDPDTPGKPGADDTPDDEWRLRDAAVTGNGDAFAVLYRRCHRTVYRYLVRRLDGDHHLADDLTSETFARALTRISSYREMGRPFVAWLLTIAGNLVADYYKSGWRRFQVPCGDLGFEHDRSSGPIVELARTDNESDVDSQVVADQLRHRVRAVLDSAIADLTDWQQQVVHLRYERGLSVRDTAVKLDTREGAVKAATYRAVRVLARDPRLRMLRQELSGDP